jgi:hypothetical protein
VWVQLRPNKLTIDGQHELAFHQHLPSISSEDWNDELRQTTSLKMLRKYTINAPICLNWIDTRVSHVGADLRVCPFWIDTCAMRPAAMRTRAVDPYNSPRNARARMA